MRSILLAAGLASLLVSVPGCRPARHEPNAGDGVEPRPAAPRIVEASSTPSTPMPTPPVSEATDEKAESPFAPMLRGTWRESKGSHTFAVTVDGSRFVAVEFQKDREVGRYEGRLRGREVAADYVSTTKGPVEGRASLELSNDGSHLFGAFTLKEQFTPIEWIRNATQ